MTEQTQAPQQKIHPMASAMFSFVNEALTLHELEARLALMENVIKNIKDDLTKIAAEEAAAKAKAEEVPVGEEIPVVEADEIIESPEEVKARKVAEYAASL